ncbi:uncharacterized protein N7482_001459 [Penicillium canariense]|uniref:Uncharacterized protein n=1 Tax=Penicillium canariense TaxID=189055 RepID=A0A9W9IFN1_9EURO|nr:uncharacterized protein N7482_001459 [Penicillium canariense]KAJ5175582.1 hypothetical protein N7482_001459 [Penicillium canariense]
MDGEKTIPIAIIGMGCRFPGGCNTPERLWELCAEAKSAWSEIPKDRFNPSAFYHRNAEKKGTFTTCGAHFLDEDVSEWDASFFNFTSDMAKTMDPQIRLLLETVFEALESGSCFMDYHDMLMKDPERLSRYFLAGNMMTFTANRISHFFDLKGPSVSVDTACSTALTALHLACQAIRNGEAKMGIVGGANLLLHPTTFVGLSSLGLTGPDGKSYSFDMRAQGYGRGEGVASLVVKPLEDALRDGDPIRAVIRETAINQDGKTPTITSPSASAQESLIRACYERAGLDPRDTPYVEAHGTGTISGDTTEMAAVAAVLAANRDPNDPLRVGSIKANLGHLEAASGMAAIIKAVKMLEVAQIPPHSLLQNLNSRIDFKGLNLAVPRTLEPWPEGQARRVSISNFGAGGANTHVILDAPDSFISSTDPETELPLNGIHPTRLDDRLVVSLSAKDKTSLRTAMRSLAEYLAQAPAKWTLNDVVYTLNERRSNFPCRVSLTGSSIDEIRTALAHDGVPVIQTSSSPRLGFVYTGQGAQWFAMGRELVERYPVYRESLERSEMILAKLGSSWSLTEELQRDEQETRVNDPAFSFPLSVAVQIALTDLLVSWGLRPAATTGHSSGEIAAAYSAGALSHEQAVGISYLRGNLMGRFIEESHMQGGMIALGLGKEAATTLLQEVTSGMLSIACINSPSSVTVSGDIYAIEKLEALCEQRGVFNRRVKVKAAYHSPHMEMAALAYLLELERHIRVPNGELSDIILLSPVTGDVIESAVKLGPRHWVRNMVQCVLFEDCLSKMILRGDDPVRQVDILVEIGPHGALAGPIRQILSQPNFSSQGIKYTSCLTRGQNAVKTVQDVAAFLYSHGSPVSLREVNAHCKGRVMPGLPRYSWNHTNRYWTDCLQLQEFCQRQYPRHDILGVRVEGLNPETAVWRNYVSTADLPWLVEHTLQSDNLFPAAGFMVMILEAAQQFITTKPESLDRVVVSNLEISNAMVVPDSPKELPTQVCLRPVSCRELATDGATYEFSIYSQQSVGQWIKHCCGRVSSEPHSPLGLVHAQNRVLSSSVDVAEYYRYLAKVGPTFGRSFQNIISLDVGDMHASAVIEIPDTPLMTMSSAHPQKAWAHPTVVDAFFHVAYAAVPKEQMLQLGPSVPTLLEGVSMSTSIETSAKNRLRADVQVLELDGRGFTVRLSIFDADNVGSPPIFYISSLHIQSLGLATRNGEDDPGHSAVQFFHTVWKLDCSMLSGSDLANAVTHSCSSEASGYSSPSLGSRDLENPITIIEHDRPPEQNGIEKGIYTMVTQNDLTNAKSLCAVHSLNDEMHHQPTRTYQEGYVQSLNQLKEFLILWVHKYPRSRILQTGLYDDDSFILSVLEGLSQGNDGSRLVVDHLTVIGRDRNLSSSPSDSLDSILERHKDQMQLIQLNISEDQQLLTEAVDEDSFDLVIAAFAPDYFENAEAALENIHALLKPGGRLLVLQEIGGVRPLLSDVVPANHASNLTGPLTLAEWSWRELLSKTKFAQPHVVIPNPHEAKQSTHSLILSTRPELQLPARKVPKSGSACIVHSISKGSNADQWLEDLLAVICAASAGEISTHRLDELPSDQVYETCIFLDVDEPVLQGMDEKRFDAVKAFVECATTMTVWVSRGGVMECTDPAQAIHIGLLRTLRLENETKRYISLDLDPHRASWSSETISVVSRIYQHLVSLPLLENGEAEYELAERQGQIYVPRLVESVDNATHYHRLSSTPKIETARLPVYSANTEAPLIAHVPGRLESLAFSEVHSSATLSSRAPEDDEQEYLEIQPQAFGINQQDVSEATGQSHNSMHPGTMGLECAGVVTKIGSIAGRTFKLGDPVLALLPLGRISNRALVHWKNVALMPTGMTFELAASIPVPFVTAYHALIRIARLAQNEYVLIQCAADGLAQAAISIAQHAKARILVVVQSARARDVLMQDGMHGLAEDQVIQAPAPHLKSTVYKYTHGRGVDVVLNSFSGVQLQAGLDCLVDCGRFVELGQTDAQQNNLLDMKHFTRGLSFTSVDIGHLATRQPEVLSEAFRKVIELIHQKLIHPQTAVHVYQSSEVHSAFGDLQNSKNKGKTVLAMNYDADVPMLKRPKRLQLPSSAAYLIVGGLSGIGREIAKWMAARGATHLVLLSRNAESNDNADLEATLGTHGTFYEIRNCDVSSEQQLQALFAEYAGRWPPIKGVIQAAGVLRNSVFSNMTYQQWTSAIDPKVRGTQNLATQLAKYPTLDFFIILSSATGVVGSPGQGNYAAAGTYQDSLACQLRSQGIPAVSVDLGSVLETGMAVRAGALARLERAGYHAHSIQEVLYILESVQLHGSHPSQIVPGIAAWSDNADLPWRREPRFDATRAAETPGHAEGGQTEGGGGGGDTSSPRARIESARSAEEVLEIIVNVIQGRLAFTFMLEEADIDNQKSLLDYGLDSLVAVELRNWLTTHVSPGISVFDIIQSQTLLHLAQKVVEKYNAQ